MKNVIVCMGFLILALFMCGCTTTSQEPASAVHETPDLLGNWSGTMYGYIEGTGYTNFSEETMTMMVRLFGENKTPPPLVLKATAQKLTENTYSFLNKAFPEMSADEALDMAMQRLCPESYRHCVRVGELASRFARMLGLDRKFRKDLKRSAKLKEGGFLALTLAAFDDFDQDEFMEAMLMGGEYHDIGKLAIPAEIINKPDRLTEEEYELVQLHPVIGEAMLVPLEAPELILERAIDAFELVANTVEQIAVKES